MNVCQKCGDKGYIKELIYCVQCKVSAEHRYCLDTLPKSKKEKVVWTCMECTQKDIKLGLIPSRKSTRISQAAERRLNRRQMRKQMSFSRNNCHLHEDSLPEKKHCSHASLFSCEESTRLPFSNESPGKQELIKKNRRFVLEDEDISNEESKQIKAETSQLVPAVSDGPSNTVRNFLPLESNEYIHSRPTINPTWRGYFNIKYAKSQTSVRLVAHLAVRACLKAMHAATLLPPCVAVQILPKSDLWPRRFQISPPTDDNVALYFFPEYESDEKVFDSILHDMIDHNLALKAVIKDLELLIFSSRELPPDLWRNLYAPLAESVGSITGGVFLNQLSTSHKLEVAWVSHFPKSQLIPLRESRVILPRLEGVEVSIVQRAFLATYHTQEVPFLVHNV